METRKIAWACFIGGCVFGLSTLAVAPRLWWLGCLSGFASGYLAYEFSEVLAAIPLAWRFAVTQIEGARQELFVAVAEQYRVVRNWFSEEHPLIYLSLLVSLPLLNVLFTSYLRTTIVDSTARPATLIVANVLVYLMMEFVLTFLGILPLYALAWWGAKSNKQYFRLPVSGNEGDKSEIETWQQLEAAGYLEQPFTYANVIRWIIRGIFVAILFFCWKIPCFILWLPFAIGYEASLFASRFIKRLFILIHSHKRLLCGFDGTLGGLSAYWLGASQMATLPEALVVIIAGGLLGALFGVANWELISKRWLKLAVNPV